MISELSLNQFERDWAQAPLRDKQIDFKKISKSTVVINGCSEISKAIVLTFLSLNDVKKLDNSIVVLTSQNDNHEIFSDIKNRADFELLSLSEYSSEADIWIETSFIMPDYLTSVDDAKISLNKANEVIAILSKIKPAKCLLISDTSVYGKLSSGFVASEFESGSFEFSENELKSLTAQSVENIFFSASHQFSFDVRVMRSAVLVCPFSNSEFVKALIKGVAENSEFNFKSKSDRVSYIYINDYLTALYYVLIYGEKGSVYNACSDDSTLTSAEIAAVVDDLFENCEVTISKDGVKPVGCAICNTRLKKLGFEPQVSFKDALLISKHAYINSDEVFMFPDAYDGKLTSVQEILLGFLMEIDRICRKHNIKYFLGGGTLLGAIRHHGFIPWDDDADVMMLREDYDRFLKILPDEIPNNLFIQSHKNEKLSHFPFTKLRINKTLFSTEFSARFPEIHNGIFLDVLAQDYTSNNKFISKLHMHAAASSRWLVLNKWRGTPVDANSKVSSFIANVLKKLFPLCVLEAVQNKFIALYKNKKNAKFLYDSMGRNVTRGAFPVEWLKEAVYVEFENTKLPVPKEYDKYLTYLYGDYMDMIPVSQRHVSHDIIQMDLGEYTNYSCKSK